MGEPIGLSPEPREVFEKAMAEYAAALGQRRPSRAECEHWSSRFHRIHVDYGIQLAIAEANAAMVWLRCGDARRAEEGLARLIEAVPRYTIAYNDLAVLRWRRGDRDGAIATLERATEHVAKNGLPLTTEKLRTNLAKMLRLRALELGDEAAFERAELGIRALLAQDAELVALYEQLAALYLRVAERDGHRRLLVLAEQTIASGREIALATKRSTAGLDNAAGLLALARDDQREAATAFSQALTGEREHAAAQANLAMLAVHYGDDAAAEAGLARARGDAWLASDLDATLAHAWAAMHAKHYSRARDLLRRAAREHDDVRPVFMLGLLEQDFVLRDQERGDDVPFDRGAYQRASKAFAAVATHARRGARPDLVAAAAARHEWLEARVRPPPVGRELEREAVELERLERERDAVEKVRLLELERQLKNVQPRAVEPQR